LSASSPALQQQVNQSAAFLHARGFSLADAQRAAYGYYYNQLQSHAHFLAFMDCFTVIGVVTLLAAPLILLTKPFKIASRAPSGH
jgi:DHA2 family multidrug resistance protein